MSRSELKLTDLNRDGGVGANSLLLELGGFTVLVDAGLHPKKSGPEATPALARLAGRDVDLVVLTHCHLDHLGVLPLVLRQQPRPPVLMSLPSLHLAERMLHNSVNVMERERAERGTAYPPLFTHEEVDRAAARFVGLPYGQTRRIAKRGEDLAVTLRAAGHVLGAAGVLLEHRGRRIFLTGDVLFAAQATVGAARFPLEHVDTLVIETTRGATPHVPGRTRGSEAARLVETCARTIRGGGCVLIPAFALGRMQEILCVLHEARRARQLPECPILCSGLGLDLVDYYDEIHRKTGLTPFSRAITQALQVQKPPRDIVPGRPPARPAIYVLSSGMMVEHTPSYRMAAALLHRPEHAICFVGYCDPDTPGGRLLATAAGARFSFDSLEYEAPVRAQVDRIHLSGHADREELIDYTLGVAPRAVVLHHGDPPARAWMAGELRARLPASTVLDPVPLETYRL